MGKKDLETNAAGFSRRRMVALVGTSALGGIAGCAGDDAETDTSEPPATTGEPTTASQTDPPTEAPTTTDPPTSTEAPTTPVDISDRRTASPVDCDAPSDGDGTTTEGSIDAEHPYILWTSEELDQIRSGIESDGWQAQSRQKMEEMGHRGDQQLLDLLDIALYDDDDAAATQKEKLMEVVNAPEPRGAAQFLTVLRYDVLRGSGYLSDEEQTAFEEELARPYIDHIIHKRSIFDPDVFNDERGYSGYDAQNRNQVNWLPNIIWPWTISANLFAAAIGDEDLIRETWNAEYSMKWYIDEYLNDSGFYGEELGKMNSTPGAMLIYATALENLGLNDLGFGYTGTGGASLRGHIRSLIRVTYPQVDLYTGRPHFPLITMGDKRRAGTNYKQDTPNWKTPAFQHALIPGYLPNGQGGIGRWRVHGAWGGETRGDHAVWDGYTGFTPKMQLPFWFELGATRWPEDGYRYFLYHMRRQGNDRYIPSLVFGAEPVGPEKPDPPIAHSGVFPDRGLGMLRAETCSEYWDSPAPAVGLRSASPYAHAVNDSFALLGMYAENRPLLLNRQQKTAYAFGWPRSIKSHNGVMIDGNEPATAPPDTTTYRKAFTDPAKLLQMRSDEVYPGTHLNRSLVVTRDYVLDLVRADSETSRTVETYVHALGEAETPVSRGDPSSEVAEANTWLGDPDGLQSSDSRSWTPVTFRQTNTQPDSDTPLSEEWFDAGVGVSLHAGGTGTADYLLGTTPPRLTESGDPDNDEMTPVRSPVGGRSLVASREGQHVGFVHAYMPFSGGTTPEGTVESLPEGNESLQGCTLDLGNGRRDVIALAPEVDTERQLDIGDEQFAFSNLVWVRIAGDGTATVATPGQS